jgi:hypothetical protein
MLQFNYVVKQSSIVIRRNSIIIHAEKLSVFYWILLSFYPTNFLNITQYLIENNKKVCMFYSYIYISRFFSFFGSIILYKLKTSNRTVTNRLSHQLFHNYNFALTIQSSKGILIRFHHLVTSISVFSSIPFLPQFECLRKLKILRR